MEQFRDMMKLMIKQELGKSEHRDDKRDDKRGNRVLLDERNLRRIDNSKGM